LARTRSQQPLLEALDQASRAQLHELIAALAAWQRPAPRLRTRIVRAPVRQPAHVVHHHEVTLGRRALCRLQAGEAIAQRLDLAIDVLIAHIRLATRNLQAVELAELRPGHHADLDRERQLAALARQLPEVQLGVAHRHDPRGADGVRVPAREALAHRLLEHRLATQALEHERRRDLAAAKARQLQLAPQLAGLALQAP